MLLDPVKTTSPAGHVERYSLGDVIVTVPTGTPIAFSEPPYSVQAARPALRAVA
jgi:hypothetical protein